MLIMQNARRNFWNKPAAANRSTAATKSFTRRASGSEFETRYIGEQLWWPITIEELAETLEAYHDDIEDCLRRMLTGEVMNSPLAQFRLVGEPPFQGSRSQRMALAAISPAKERD